MARSRHSAGNGKTARRTKRAVLSPPKDFHDADWREKIAIAKEAKEAGAELRKDKPATFSTRHVTNWKTS